MRFLLGLGLLGHAAAQVSQPLLAADVTHGNVSHVTNNKFIARSVVDEAEVPFKTRAPEFQRASECPHNVELEWHHELKASLYSTPVLTDLYNDGQRDVLANSYVRYVEALEGYDGHKVPGWPFMFSKSVFHSSPLLHDVDKDGTMDIVTVTSSGEIIFLHEDGRPFHESFRLPKLGIKRNWYAGLDEEHIRDETVGDDRAHRRTESQGPPMDGGYTGGGGGGGGARTLLSFDDAETRRTGYTMGADDMGFLPDGALETWEIFSRDVRDPPNLEQADPARAAVPPYNVEPERDADKVFTNPHVICNPVIADVDADGHPDLVMAVSYYFGEEDEMTEEERAEASRDTKLSKYVAGAIVVFDLDLFVVKWTEHLDLSTDLGKYRAYIFSSPIVLDMDGDGVLEIILGTSLGYIYVYHGDGRLKDGFPIAMGEMEAHVAAEDLNGDGKIELVAVDFNSNVLCFTADGRELWETRISGVSVHGATIGDVDGDGQLDVVVGAEEGHIWALNGKTGKPLKHFPFKTHGRIYSPILLVDLARDAVAEGATALPFANDRGLQLAVVPFDGYLYLIDGKTGCTEKIDIGEHSYSMVLADDMTGNGKLDLVVGTMNGNVYMFGTEAPYHPLKSWTSFSQGRNVFTYRANFHGIFFTQRGHWEVSGRQMHVAFEIVDKRRVGPVVGNYLVSISIGGGSAMVLHEETYSSPGKYLITVDAPHEQMNGALVISMTNEFGQLYTDSVPVSFNLHYHRIIKWVLVVPFAAMAGLLIFTKTVATPLPMTL